MTNNHLWNNAPASHKDSIHLRLPMTEWMNACGISLVEHLRHHVLPESLFASVNEEQRCAQCHQIFVKGMGSRDIEIGKLNRYWEIRRATAR